MHVSIIAPAAKIIGHSKIHLEIAPLLLRLLHSNLPMLWFSLGGPAFLYQKCSSSQRSGVGNTIKISISPTLFFFSKSSLNSGNERDEVFHGLSMQTSYLVHNGKKTLDYHKFPPSFITTHNAGFTWALDLVPDFQRSISSCFNDSRESLFLHRNVTLDGLSHNTTYTKRGRIIVTKEWRSSYS